MSALASRTELFTSVQVAERLGADWTTYRVEQEVKRGIFPHRRVGRRGFLRFTEDDIATYLKRIAVDQRGGLTPGSQRRQRRNT